MYAADGFPSKEGIEGRGTGDDSACLMCGLSVRLTASKVHVRKVLGKNGSADTHMLRHARGAVLLLYLLTSTAFWSWSTNGRITAVLCPTYKASACQCVPVMCLLSICE